MTGTPTVATTHAPRPRRNRWRLARALCACGVSLLLAAGCSDTNEPTSGALRVTVATAGGDIDLDGYSVAVDTAQPQAVGVNGAVVILGLPTGPHDVALSGVAANCTVGGQNPRSVTIIRGDTVQVAFAVSCAATGVQVTSATTGIDVDPDGYLLAVDGGPPTALGVNGTLTITRLSAGSHTLALSGVTANCVVAGTNPRSVSVATGQTVPVAFAVTCGAVTGVVQVMAATTGIDFDPNGYTLQLDQGTPQPFAVNATVSMPGLGAGDYTLTVGDLAGNCTVAGDNPRVVHVTTGGVTRDTARTTFAVTCVAVTGAIQVTAATSGIDLDPNGYALQLDQGSPYALAANTSVTIPGLSAGDYNLTVGDVAGNCTLAGANPRTVHVTTGGVTRDTARTTFAVSCVATTGAIQATAATSGIDLDPNGYTIQVDAGPFRGVTTNGTVTIDALGAGDHSVRLAGAAANCTVSGNNPRTVTVTTGGTTRDTARTTFAVTCVALTGAVQVTAVTSGDDLDPNGYTVLLDDGQQRQIGANGTATLDGVSGGDHGVVLDAVAGNCTVTGPNPQTVHVTTGGVARDTARATFQVSCVRVDKIAFQSGATVEEASIAVVYADGSNTVGLAQGTGPTWSPNGARIAYAAISCDYYYYYYCYPIGLAVINADGSGFAQLTSDGSDERPAWSPDGTKIAFTSSRSGRRGIHVMNADGLIAPTLLTNTPLDVSKPAWSPDGAQLAFTCVVDSGNSDICFINANGTGFTRLTSDLAQDVAPAWKPDGSRIAFATTRYGAAYELAVMNPDGGDVTRVSPGTAAWDPAWKPDGSKIVFANLVCGPSSCDSDGLLVMNASGLGLTRVTTGVHYAPAWRP